MDTKQFKLESDTVDELLKFAFSIQHHSTEYARAILQLRALERSIHDLYVGREQRLRRAAYEEGEIDPLRKISEIQEGKDGQVTVKLFPGPSPAPNSSESQEDATEAPGKPTS